MDRSLRQQEEHRRAGWMRPASTQLPSRSISQLSLTFLLTRLAELWSDTRHNPHSWWTRNSSLVSKFSSQPRQALPSNFPDGLCFTCPAPLSRSANASPVTFRPTCPALAHLLSKRLVSRFRATKPPPPPRALATVRPTSFWCSYHHLSFPHPSSFHASHVHDCFIASSLSTRSHASYNLQPALHRPTTKCAVMFVLCCCLIPPSSVSPACRLLFRCILCSTFLDVCVARVANVLFSTRVKPKREYTCDDSLPGSRSVQVHKFKHL